MRKAFEKQIKTIEDQGQKQIGALENLKPKERLVNVNDDYEDKLLLSKEREIFRNIYNKRLEKIEELIEKFDFNNLIFTITSTGKTIGVARKDDLLTIKEAKESQKNFNKYLKLIRKDNTNNEQQKMLANINMLFNGSNKAINFIDAMVR